MKDNNNNNIYATGGHVPLVEFVYQVRVTVGDSGLCCHELSCVHGQRVSAYQHE